MLIFIICKNDMISGIVSLFRTGLLQYFELLIVNPGDRGPNIVKL